MHLRTLPILLLSALLLTGFKPYGGGGGFGGMGGKRGAPEPVEPVDHPFSPIRSPASLIRDHGLLDTGIEAIYPEGADCPRIDSRFGTTSRGDGSRRSPRYFHGHHSGADITVPEGTPILAIADGTVVEAKEGSEIGGIELIVQHSPQQTGLPLWIYAQYKHLRELPPLAVGERVKMGAPIAFAGVSGTTGGYYGDEGHSHLHIALFTSPSDRFTSGMSFVPEAGRWLDPLALFLDKGLDGNALASLPKQEKRARIRYRLESGEVVPAESRIIWPFACKAR